MSEVTGTDETEVEKSPSTLTPLRNNLRARSEPSDARTKKVSQSNIGTLDEEESELEKSGEEVRTPIGKCARFDFAGSTILDEESSVMKANCDDQWELVPPDGGWGWLILFGSMLVNILVPGTVKSFGVLFVEFLEVFEASATAAAWIPALCYFLYSSLGPLSSILSVKYSYRTVTMLGGTFAAVGMILSFWASSVTYLYFSYGIMVGTGAGLSFPPTVYIVTNYFVRLRGLANGLCISGSALGSIILPPVLRILLEYYGYRGAVLIMGGITLNVWVGAIFYHPVEQHMKRVLKTDYISETTKNPLDSPTSENIKLKYSLENESLLEPSKPTNDIFVRSASSAAVSAKWEREQDRTRKISMPQPSRDMSTNELQILQTNGDYYSPTSRLISQQSPKVKIPVRSPSTSSFNYVSTPYHGSTLSALHPSQFASSLTLKSITFSSKKKGVEEVAVEDKEEVQRNQYFDTTLLKDPIYLIILLSNCTNAISYTNFIILLPTYATLIGFDKTSAAYLISVVSAFDLIGRIGGSALSDLGLMPKQWYFIGGLLISGIALSILPSTSTYYMICVCCGVFGLASGVYVGITAIVMADLLGDERLTSTYGISLFVNGILQLIGPPLCGVWYEIIGNYRGLFFSLGCILIGGASLWLIVPFIKKPEKPKK